LGGTGEFSRGIQRGLPKNANLFLIVQERSVQSKKFLIQLENACRMYLPRSSELPQYDNSTTNRPTDDCAPHMQSVDHRLKVSLQQCSAVRIHGQKLRIFFYSTSTPCVPLNLKKLKKQSFECVLLKAKKEKKL